MDDGSPSVVASAGAPSPLTPIWDFTAPLRPVEDDLPFMTVPRGGITFIQAGPYSSRPHLSPMRRRWNRIKGRVMRPSIYRLRSTYRHWRDYYKEDDDWWT